MPQAQRRSPPRAQRPARVAVSGKHESQMFVFDVNCVLMYNSLV